MTQPVSDRRTFAIISHPDAGKTTITEKLLLLGNLIQVAGTVKGRKSDRHATSDWMTMEKERGISVTSSVMQFPYRDCTVNLLDTPGHRQLLQSFISIGLQPRFATKARLKCRHHLAFIKAKLLAYQTRGLMAKTMIRIAIFKIALRRTMIRKNKLIRLTMLFNMTLYSCTQCVQIALRFMVAINKLQLRYPAQFSKCFSDSIKGRTRRCPAYCGYKGSTIISRTF